MKFEVPPSINFLELGLYNTDDGVVRYNIEIMRSLLEYNGFSICDFDEGELAQLLITWYINHRKNGGEPDMCMETASDTVRFEPVFGSELFFDATLEPPKPEQLKDIRKNTDLTQAQISQMLGLTDGSLIGDYENGIKIPSKQTYTLFLLLIGQHPSLKLIAR